MISKKWIQRAILLSICLQFAAAWNLFAQETVTVTIERAEKTEYVKDAESGEQVIRFTGEVSLTVDNNGIRTVIQAEDVIFNRARATVYASGQVVFTQSGEGRNNETLTASTLLFNTRTLEGVFDKGRVVQESSGNINLPTGSVLVVFADSFGRENGGTVTFRNGSLTFCDDPEPHWKINASRIWLLPGNEFAIFSGLLYVGNYPVMYIPFFYYPKEEMVFNPSFGYDGRKGYFTQTTTYLIGRKGLPESTGSSGSSGSSSTAEGLFDFMKTTSLKKQVREGLFMHNLDEDDSLPDNSLKILADGYSNLGYMAGIEGEFNPEKYFSSVAFGAYIGVSRTLFPVYSPFGNYTTFSPSNQRYWDHGWILGHEVPFRFAADLKASFAVKPFSFTVSLPVYSDPYFTGDFLADRKESMDWINFLMNNVASAGDLSGADTSNATSLSAYSLSFSGSVSTPEWVSRLNPWVQDLTVSSFTSQINFSTKANSVLTGETKAYDPNRYFYYPSSVYPLKTSMRIGGKLLSVGSSRTGGASSTIAGLELPDGILPSSDDGESTAEPAVNQASSVTLEPPPSLSVTKASVVALQGFTWDISYSISPSLTNEVNYDAASFNSPSDIDWSRIKNQYLQIRCPVVVRNTSSFRGGFLGVNNTLEFSPVYQEHSDIDESFYTETALQQMLESDLKARALNLTDTNSLVIKPFQYVNGLSGSSLSWNTGIKVVRTEFTGTVEKPEWKYIAAGLDKDSFTAHNITAELAATQLSNRYKESVTLKVNLPPMNKRIEGTLRLTVPPCTSFSISTAYSADDRNIWTHEPVSQSSSWSFFDKKLSFSQSYRYNVADEHHEALSVSLSGFGGSLSYNMLYTTPYEYVEKNGWIARTEKEFLPYSISARYVLPATNWQWINNQISLKPVASSSLSMDLIRPTQSSFNITSGFTFKITDFLDLSLTTESQNKVVYRYVQNFFSSGVTIPGEDNILLDLLDSFAFWNPTLRQNSGFKLRNIAVSLDHNLHDWTLHSEFKVSPRLVKEGGISRYDYSPYFILSVKWNPMSSLKTTIEDKYGEFVLNPAE